MLWCVVLDVVVLWMLWRGGCCVVALCKCPIFVALLSDELCVLW